tara:strand:- start:88 stop:492 length:405 start_codon:yes stop_codon:yes gene_type:complete
MKQKYNRKKRFKKTRKGGMGCSRKQGNKYKPRFNTKIKSMRRRISNSGRNSMNRRNSMNNSGRGRMSRRASNKRSSMKGGTNFCSDFNTNKEVLDITTGGGTMWDGGAPYTWGKTGQYYGLESHFDRFDKSFNI